MKLAPMTTARFDSKVLATSARLSASVRRIVYVREICARYIEMYWLRAGSEQKRVIGMPAAVYELHVPACGVNRVHVCAQVQVDVLILVELRRSEEGRLLGICTGQKAL